MTGQDPFTVLGLPARPDLTDKQVRAAWRAVAAATHPDRADGGDPGRYAAASAAYAALRTAWGRSEAYADLIAQAPPPARPPARRRVPRSRLLRAVALVPARIWRGRPLRLIVRLLAAVLLAVAVLHAGAGGPAAGPVRPGATAARLRVCAGGRGGRFFSHLRRGGTLRGRPAAISAAAGACPPRRASVAGPAPRHAAGHRPKQPPAAHAGTHDRARCTYVHPPPF